MTLEPVQIQKKKGNKMYQIVICDDDQQFREEFSRMITQVMQELSLECHVVQCKEAEQVEKLFTEKKRIDLLFLDIELGKSLGMELGKYIREHLYDFETQIVYVSYDQGYAMQLFETIPLDFLVKPIAKEKLEHTIKRFVRKQEGSKNRFCFKSAQGMIELSYEEILYFQSRGHKLVAHTMEGEQEFYGKLEEVEGQVPSYFLRIHKSYLVNVHFVRSFHHDSVYLTNRQQLTISRPYKEPVQDYVSRRVREM